MTLFQEAFYGGILVGLISAMVVHASIRPVKEIIREMKATKNA